jgi:hypothetical protein
MGLFDDDAVLRKIVKLPRQMTNEEILAEIKALREDITALRNAPSSGISRVVDALAQIGLSIRDAAVVRADPVTADLSPALAAIEEVKELLRTLPPPVPPGDPPPAEKMPARWEFAIERDENNLITDITATPIYEGETENGLGA